MGDQTAKRLKLKILAIRLKSEGTGQTRSEARSAAGKTA